MPYSAIIHLTHFVPYQRSHYSIIGMNLLKLERYLGTLKRCASSSSSCKWWEKRFFQQQHSKIFRYLQLLFSLVVWYFVIRFYVLPVAPYILWDIITSWIIKSQESLETQQWSKRDLQLITVLRQCWHLLSTIYVNPSQDWYGMMGTIWSQKRRTNQLSLFYVSVGIY